MGLGAKLNVKDEMTMTIDGRPADVDLDIDVDVVMTDDAAMADAVLVFVADKAELAGRGTSAIEAAVDDRLAWIAYPKAGKLGTDLNRDILWEQLSALGIRPVRQISIDDTWSALRFRPA